ncbi:hypothetical protein SAMN05444411_11266 [Lutibacter oricola]|uniref:Sensory/regulatory protein RpfC n=1 Tax=Lutibacter oricola TaxID=762486 RepID=A0A1H3FV86_9FLAO|nr:response regulator [Lutibacter oricola]SDX94871.1 hypothetical protein SAMN05444411_11266 [Lutibacter oricola]
MSKGVIFCIDDEKMVLNSLKTELKNAVGQNYIIETAESGIEALEAIDNLLELNFEIPIVIVDYAMPVMKGDEFLMKLHKKSPLTLNILLTGQATLEGVTNSINNGGLYRYFSKPWDSKDLILTVKHALKSYNQGHKLHIQNKELMELSTSLENKVQQRTLELQKKNELLVENQSKISIQKEELENYRNHLENLVEERTLELTEAKNKAEESDRLKSAFLANMSHEIRTPMNGIMGFTTLLKQPELKSDKRLKYIEVIEKSGERLLGVINDVIDISKIEAGLVEMLEVEVDINNELDYIYTFFKLEANKKGLQFSCETTLSNQEAVVKADKVKLNAILVNLVKNTLKYTNTGSVCLGYNLKKRESNFVLEFFIKDTGIGIPKDRQAAIFDRFVQADIEDKKALQGAGLGLSISKAYVEMMGGEIWVESEEGKGATFYFTLPYKPVLISKINNSIITNQIEDKVISNKKTKILIVDDDESAREYLSIILENFNVEILLANNGKEALTICETNLDIDLILMDLKMPILNGYEAIKEIKKINNNVVIIAQTANAFLSDKEKTLNAGFNDYLAKPISRNHLISVMQKYINLQALV